MRNELRWNDDPARAELRALYAEVDALMAPHSCEGTAECCNFANTGREPTPTTVEVAEVLHAARSIGVPNKRKLPLAAGERRCELLSDEGRCRVYASRPFGCRTYFCHRMSGPAKLPRTALVAIARRIVALSERAFPRDPLPRPLSRALEDARNGRDLVAYLARARSR